MSTKARNVARSHRKVALRVGIVAGVGLGFLAASPRARAGTGDPNPDPIPVAYCYGAGNCCQGYN